MKPTNDKKIQELLEKGLSAADSGLSASEERDLKVYQLLFGELKKEPDAALSQNFSAKVVGELQLRQDRVSDRRFYVLMVAGIFAGLAGAYGLLSFFSREYALGIAAVALQYKWLFIFGVVCVLIIQYLDQKLVKENLRIF